MTYYYKDGRVLAVELLVRGTDNPAEKWHDITKDIFPPDSFSSRVVVQDPFTRRTDECCIIDNCDLDYMYDYVDDWAGWQDDYTLREMDNNEIAEARRHEERLADAYFIDADYITYVTED